MNMTANIHYAPRSLALTRLAAAGALLLFAILVCAEAARAFGYTDTTPRVVRATFVMFTVLAIGAAIVEHFIAATRELQRLNAELERRLAGKSEEIKSTYARIEEAKQEWALISERQRILADMHDGVGTSLIGLLRYVQSGNLEVVELERRVKTALQEMRIAIDALEPADGDLGAVLARLRYRLEPLLESTGVRLAWDAGELPQVEALDPAAVFAIQRIVLEAIANALKHSGARSISIALRALDAAGVEIRIEDDGRGFDAGHPASGLGLGNMRSRAQRLGAHFGLLSSPGRGTTVILAVPCKLGPAPAGRAASTPLHWATPARVTPA